MDLEKIKPIQTSFIKPQRLVIIPQGKKAIENPSENLLANVQFLHDKFSYSLPELWGRTTLLICYILTGLSINTIENNKINPVISYQLQDFIARHKDYINKQVMSVLAFATKN